MLLSVMGGLARCCKAGWTDIRATQLPVREGGGTTSFSESVVYGTGRHLCFPAVAGIGYLIFAASLNVVKPQEQGNQMVMC